MRNNRHEVKFVYVITSVAENGVFEFKGYKDMELKKINLDLAFLFSDPLINTKGEKCDPVLHNDEYQMLLEIALNGSIIKRAITINSFQEVI